jgi:hypothetical protein
LGYAGQGKPSMVATRETGLERTTFPTECPWTFE